MKISKKTGCGESIMIMQKDFQACAEEIAQWIYTYISVLEALRPQVQFPAALKARTKQNPSKY